MPSLPLLSILVVADKPCYAAQVATLLSELGYYCLGVAPNTTAASLLVAQHGWPEPLLAPGSQCDFLLSATSPPFGAACLHTAGWAAGDAPIGAQQPATEEVAVLRQALDSAVSRLLAATQPSASSPSPAAAPPTGLVDDGLLPETLFVREEGLLTRVNLPDIRWVYADGRQCQLALPGRLLTVRQPFRKLARLLPPTQFVQIQRSYIVNVAYIERLDTTRNLVQVADQLLPIGLTYREALLRRLRVV